MNNVDSEKAVHTVSEVLDELEFETYVVAIKNEGPKNKEFDAVINGEAEMVAKLLLSFLNAVPKQVIEKMHQHFHESVAAEILRRNGDHDEL